LSVHVDTQNEGCSDHEIDVFDESLLFQPSLTATQGDGGFYEYLFSASNERAL
jgi:hypothetical protein